MMHANVEQLFPDTDDDARSEDEDCGVDDIEAAVEDIGGDDDTAMVLHADWQLE
jgi:hypothetical protein